MQRGPICFALALFLAPHLAATPLEDLAADYREARKNFDPAAAEALLLEFEAYLGQDDSAEAKMEFVRTALLVAELNRLDYEEKGLTPLEKRRLGKKIDDAAQTAHKLLETMEDSSEKYRMAADLWGARIRSNFQGKKFGKKMEEASDKALELGEDNPYAHVTASKRPLFAPEKRGGDIDKALKHLNKALELRPGCESALILRGILHERNDNLQLARKDWQQVLDANPKCRPAKAKLENTAAGGGQQAIAGGSAP